VNIPNQFPQIGVFLADNRFVPILEEVPVAFVPPIETDRIPGKQSSHQARKGHRPRAEKKVSVIWHQDPRIAGRFQLRKKHGEALNKILVIVLVQEYLATLYPSDHDVVQNTGCVKTG
jgi:hypothetical protein